MKYEVEVNELGTAWKVDGKLHREDGPAMVSSYGTQMWCIDGRLHREDGPAIEYVNGTKKWLVDGKLHREDGPAVIDENGHKMWFLNGIGYTEHQFNEKTTKEPKELTINEIEQLLGYSVKIVK